jgi:hypothetical protein
LTVERAPKMRAVGSVCRCVAQESYVGATIGEE